jgi:hypothetical protein
MAIIHIEIRTRQVTTQMRGASAADPEARFTWMAQSLRYTAEGAVACPQLGSWVQARGAL